MIIVFTMYVWSDGPFDAEERYDKGAFQTFRAERRGADGWHSLQSHPMLFNMKLRDHRHLSCLF